MENNYMSKVLDKYKGNEDFRGALGDSFSSIGDENFNALGEDMVNANGKPLEPSKAIIIKVVNTSTDNQSNVTLLNAAAVYGASDYVVANTTFSVGSGQLSYRQLLGMLMGSKLKIGLTSFEAINSSSSVAKQQVTSQSVITYYNVFGDQEIVHLNPRVRTNQFQGDVADEETPYWLTSLTKFVISTLYASTTLNIFLYPSEVDGKRYAIPSYAKRS